MNFFSNKSHVYTTSKTCEALNSIDGIECKLLSTDDSLIDRKSREDFFKSIEVSEFPVESIKSIGNIFKNNSFRVANWLETIFVNLSMTKYVLFHRNDFDVLYFRDSTLFFPILISKHLLRKPIFMELHAVLHSFSKRWLTEFIAKRANGLISISVGLKKYYDKINNIGIVSFCSASDPSQFHSVLETQIELREKLRLPKDKIILGYVGNLSFTGNYDSYGFEDIIESIPLMDDNVVLVGVGQKDVNETKHLVDIAKKLGIAERVIFIPRVPRYKVSRYLKSFDILVHPNAGAQIGNSPAKLFEWFLTGRPIVAANTPAIAEILIDNENSLLVEYKEPISWAEAVMKILNDKNLKRKLVAGALISSEKYTWKMRGYDIANFIETNTKIL